MGLKVPVAVTKILKARGTSYDKWIRIQRHYKRKLQHDAGCFTHVLMGPKFVFKRDQYRGDECSLVKDFKFIQKMRSDPKARRHFPESRLFGDIVVQERCDKNPDLYRKYNRQIHALAKKYGVGDIHEYNIGWKKIRGEWVPVFFDLGFRHRPVKVPKGKRGKRPSWFLPAHEVDFLDSVNTYY